MRQPLIGIPPAFPLSALLLAALLPTAQGAALPPTPDPTYGMTPPARKIVSPKPVGEKAFWIWTSAAKDNQTIGARKTFDLPRLPKRAVIYVAVDNRFALYANGARIGESAPGSGEVWREGKRFDLTGHLRVGRNVLAIEALNEGGAAGIVAALRLQTSDGVREIVTDGSWRASDAPLPDGWRTAAFDDSDWATATKEVPLGGGGAWASGVTGWPGLSGDIAHLREIPFKPTAVVHVKPGRGAIQNAANAVKGGEIVVSPAPDGTPDAQLPELTIDFGREITGRVQIKSASRTPVRLAMSYGESLEEALNGPYTGVQKLEIPAGGVVAGANSAYRYARIVFQGGANPARISVLCRHLYYPVRYLGSFDSSDPLLNRIWYVGAYTCHLCMQDDIWDAPKRDRARWMGDLQVSGEVINVAFLDHFLMERTMDRLRAEAGTPPRQHVNGIPGYSCAWVVGMADFYRHTGDLAYVKRHRADLVSIMDYFKGELDDRGIFANKRGTWSFVDWSPNFNGTDPHAFKTTHFYMVLMLKEGAWLLREAGDKADADRFDRWAKTATQAAQRYLLDRETGTFGDRWQENAMAIYSGVATPEQRKSIWKRVLGVMYPEKLMITPYYHNYSIFAMSRADQTSGALKFVRSYWGGMIKEGATTFWEGYDTRWPKESYHKYLQADNGMGYFVSLSHGWSAGATAWLTESILGVRPTSGGFKTAVIQPNLVDLSWAKGAVPTPHGLIRVSYRKTDGKLTADLDIPNGVDATVLLPGSAPKRMSAGHRRLVSP